MNPKHIDNITDPNRKAIAPYNFVELPDKVVEAEELPSGDRYHLERKTGNIECTLTTESPLYIRCGLTKEEFQAGKEAKDLPDFFYTDPASKSQKPVLPGSSLRGMLRTLVEIVSFSKIQPVTKNKLFYRSISDPSYRSQFIQTLPKCQKKPNPLANCYKAKIKTGFLSYQSGSYIIEECEYGRIHHSRLPHPLYLTYQSEQLPDWQHQHNLIYVNINPEDNHFFHANNRHRQPFYLRYREVTHVSPEKEDTTLPATLVITGHIDHKKLEFAFLHKLTGNKFYLSKEPQQQEEPIIRLFQSEEQITKWQENAFPKDKPSLDSRQKHGYFLKDEILSNPDHKEPVFFLVDKEDEKKVRFLGRAQMFRLPYDLLPLELVPEELRKPSDMDIAEAIFGYVDGESPRDKARASRIFVGDATCISSGNVWWKNDFEETVTPKILSSPKPTTFQHYLVQTSTERTQLKHYSPQPEQKKTVIRGHKMYWHKPHGHEDIEETDTTEIENKKSQYTQIKPIKAGISFKFNIRFENLSNAELGALLWVLSLSSDQSQTLETGKQGEKYCFSLGMGKPLGMGAVKIDYELYLGDRPERYKNLFHNNEWKTGEEDQSETAQKEEKCVIAFEKYVLDWICCQDYPKDRSREQLQHLKELPRIEMLLAMLQWDKIPSVDKTRYMRIEPKPNEYAERPVLPTPLDVMDLPDNRRFYNSPPSPSTSGGSGGISGGSGNTPKPILKGSGKGKPIKKSQQSQQQQKPKDNSGGNNSAALARPSKPKR